MTTTPQVVGIDLGTTYSLAAYVQHGRPVVVRDEKGVALVPSVISFHEDGTVLVGSAAKARALADPEHTIFSVKRLMGRSLAELRQEQELIPHQLVEREIEPGRKVLHVVIGGREHTPEELSALILKELRRRAGNPTKAVITVPAYFDDSQRQATRDAGRIAGLDVLRIVNEPTAAALAYGLDQRHEGIVAVYDLGGGTFDCSILSIRDGVFRVLSTHGDTHLGGDDFDRALMSAVAADLGLDLQQRDPELLQHLRDVAEKTKILLSTLDAADFVLHLPARNINYRRTFRRKEFEEIIRPWIERSLESCRQALRDAEIEPRQVDEIVLVGGSTRIPYVRRRVADFFGKAPHAELNPDEVVALGAAIQADILAGGQRNMLLLDVVPLSLGIETFGGAVDKLIHRNSTIPVQATARYSTQFDGQTAIQINIYQGERELAKDCRKLGTFTLSGIPPMPAMMPQVDVTFLVDANGMLTVRAKEQRSGKEASVTVQPSHGLSRDEVERLVLESVEHAHEDFTARRWIELKNKAETDLRYTKKALDHVGQALTVEQRHAIDQAVATVEQALQSQDVDTLHRAVAQLGEVTQPLAMINFNAVAKAVLKHHTLEQIDPAKL
jgi:Fe-S protein assembly chaperone HscA